MCRQSRPSEDEPNKIVNTVNTIPAMMSCVAESTTVPLQSPVLLSLEISQLFLVLLFLKGKLLLHVDHQQIFQNKYILTLPLNTTGDHK